MAIHNNNFSMDDILDRSERVSLLQYNVDKIASEVGITGDLLLWAQNCEKDWREISGEAEFQKAHTGSCFSLFQDAQNKCVEYYQKVKNLLKAVIAPFENADEIMRAYSIDGRTPVTREGLETAVDDLIAQHAIYKAAGAEWVIPDHFVDELKILREKMSELHTAARTQREKAKKCADAAKKRFDEDTLKLKLVYEMCAIKWGKNSSNFIILGMLPKSMIWTKHVPPAPGEFRFDSSAKIFRWAIIDGADKYEAHFRESKESGHWTSFYEGAENSCAPPEGLKGSFDFRVRAIAGSKEGHWSKEIKVIL